MRFWFALGVLIAFGGGLPAAGAADYVLALSWTPTFCALTGSAKGKVECRDPEDRHLSLHGLWPQPRDTAYCGVPETLVARDKAGDWDALPPVSLSTPAQQQDLDLYMPGARSGLDRHQWIKHGSCSGRSPEAYFTLALALTKAATQTETGRLVAAHAGNVVEQAALCDALERDFGPSIRDAASIEVGSQALGAKSRAVLAEIRIHLREVKGTLALTTEHLAVGAARLRCKNRPLALP